MIECKVVPVSQQEDGAQKLAYHQLEQETLTSNEAAASADESLRSSTEGSSIPVSHLARLKSLVQTLIAGKKGEYMFARVSSSERAASF